jgi:UDP-glucose 4-epimerase
MLESKKTILVTGGAGYIGSHAVKALEANGHRVIILDNLVYGHKDLVERNFKAKLIVGDVSDRQLLAEIFTTYKIDAVMHFAAYAYVGESVTEPTKYYQNNVLGSIALIESMREHGIQNIVFSSTCATYGIPQYVPIDEEHPQNPINPYGFSKVVVENVLRDYDRAYGLKSIIFRYFNAAGADPDGSLGEDHTPETHLIPIVLEVAGGQRDRVTIFGNDYDTPDGTCVRDYIHVSDLAAAHVLGLEHLLEHQQSNLFNLGNGNGFSVRQVIESAQRVTNRSIPILECDRRMGDPAVLIGGSSKAVRVLGWQPKYANLDTIITHAWNWHQTRHLRRSLVQQESLSNERSKICVG